MVAITEFHNDYDFFDHDTTTNDELDLAFLEAINESESLFAINDSFFDSLNTLSPQPAFVPTLHTSVFEEPVQHAVWMSPAWPATTKHFPS